MAVSLFPGNCLDCENYLVMSGGCRSSLSTPSQRVQSLPTSTIQYLNQNACLPTTFNCSTTDHIINQSTGQSVSQSRELQSSADEPLSKTNLYIRGLAPNTTDEDLFKLCHRFGKILSTKVINDPITSKCKGYGFVDFELAQTAEIAVTTLKNQGIQVQMARLQEQDPTNLYFENLPFFFNELELEMILSPIGRVISTRILRDFSGRSRGIGFTRMESKQQCEAIIQAYHGKFLEDEPIYKQLIPWRSPLNNDQRMPLIVKFADGGNRKKMGISLRQRQELLNKTVALSAYANPQSLDNCSSTLLPMTVLPPTGIMSSTYPAPSFPVTSYQVPPFSGWYQQAEQQYLLPFTMAPVLSSNQLGQGISSVDSEMFRHLSSNRGRIDVTSSGELTVAL
jgi:RNA recognition motif-containing protein